MGGLKTAFRFFLQNSRLKYLLIKFSKMSGDCTFSCPVCLLKESSCRDKGTQQHSSLKNKKSWFLFHIALPIWAIQVMRKLCLSWSLEIPSSLQVIIPLFPGTVSLVIWKMLDCCSIDISADDRWNRTSQKTFSDILSNTHHSVHIHW